MITLSINVLELDKARFKEVTKRDGKKALYADIILIETPNGQYGDFMVKQSVTKEERLAKKEMPILGNAKYVSGGKPAPAPVAEAGAPPESDDVPF